MARSTPPKKRTTRKRRYASLRVARDSAWRVTPDQMMRAWRRVLQRRLRGRMREHVLVELHDNTHTMITYHRHRGFWRVRLHHMFLAASDEVLTALCDFIRGNTSGSSGTLDRYIEDHRALIRKVPPEQLRRRLRIDPKGEHHDLTAIFDRLNARYFRGKQVRATITFGSAPRDQGPRKSIRMGSYASESRVIRIHPALDQHNVPEYFVEWIVFHEMLHHVHRARRDANGRRCVHTPEFNAHERRFHAIKRAQAWEDENLEMLLRSRV
jgi:hypothetical protein